MATSGARAGTAVVLRVKPDELDDGPISILSRHDVGVALLVKVLDS
jgi:hypothetical protein